MECPVSQSDEAGAGAVSKTVWPLSRAFRCQECKEGDAKTAKLASGSETHLWKAESKSVCAFAQQLQYVSRMRPANATHRHQQLGEHKAVAKDARQA